MNEKTGNENIGTLLVVGAGIGGIRSALDLAECGYRVILTDSKPHIGGILSQLDYQFPTNRCGMCKMLPTVNRDECSEYCLRKGLFHENIEILLSSELISLEGEAGNFEAAFNRKPQLIDPDLCVGCAECLKVCPVDVPDTFNLGLSMRKAVYLPTPHKIPNSFVIDTDSCSRCGRCEPVCPTGAIKFSEQGRKKFNILVVDDELIVRDSIKEWLEYEGFSVDMAASGKDALEQLGNKSYQLMLLDIKMPEMDGVTVLHRAKEKFPDICVLMMTAYATVETAIGAMKIGAMDYLLKPFDNNAVIPKIEDIYSRFQASQARIIKADAVILSCGTDFYNPAEGKNCYGYGVFPGVVTSLEFERIISGTGPCMDYDPSEKVSNNNQHKKSIQENFFLNRLVRPHDKKPVKKIAWFQCTGSRDLQADADFCSSVCCMYAVKEALIVKRETDGEAQTVIFYMDMRTFGKQFQRYRDSAEKEYGVRFENARIHSVVFQKESEDLEVRYIDSDGMINEESFDMIVLPTGQRPARGSEKLSEITNISLNRFGFAQTEPFFAAKTDRDGIFAGGSFSGLKDISDSVIQSSAAAMCASGIIKLAGKTNIPEPEHKPASAEPLREPPRVMMAICTCGKKILEYIDKSSEERGRNSFAKQITRDPDVSDIIYVDHLCTDKGWTELIGKIRVNKPNRLVVGACMPHLYSRKIKESESETGLDSSFISVADILSPLLRSRSFNSCTLRNHEQSTHQNHGDSQNDRQDIFTQPETQIIRDGEENLSLNQRVSNKQQIHNEIEKNLRIELSRVRWADTSMTPLMPVTKKALILGGGIAGMTAALAIANSGFHTDLVELTETLGGNIRHLTETIEGYSIKNLMDQTIEKVEKHPLIQIHTKTHVVASFGEAGHFLTTVENQDRSVQTLEHGVIILATGGKETKIDSYRYGSHKAIVTQLEFEHTVADKSIISDISSVVMIQCAGTREEPRNYCSRVCCTTSVRQALLLKKENPDINIYILYRDMMTYGFSESFYTEAREAGVIFIRYTPERKPQVNLIEGKIYVNCFEPVIRQHVEIETDFVVLAAGFIPNETPHFASLSGLTFDKDGFFKEAESKWRPVDSLKEGIFACGLAHSPRNITESVSTAQAAAQHAVRILCRSGLGSGKNTAKVRHTICSLCGLCIESCPYQARDFDRDHEKILVNPVSCQGCGACASICPNKASVVQGFASKQFFEMIDASVRC